MSFFASLLRDGALLIGFRKRQFDGKIVKWGLRKNRKQGEPPRNTSVETDGRRKSTQPSPGRWRSENGMGVVKLEPIESPGNSADPVMINMLIQFRERNYDHVRLESYIG